MKKIRIKCQVLVLMVILLLAGFPQAAMAETMEFPELYMKVDVPQGTIVLKPSLNNADPLWAEAGIVDVKAKKEEYEKMGVVVAFYQKDVPYGVTIASKTSQQTYDIYNFEELSSEERRTFLDSLFQKNEDAPVAEGQEKMPEIEVTSEEYAHRDYPFYTIHLTTKKENENEKGVSEIIYGTIINGRNITFDAYCDTGDKIDETFLKQIVDSAVFTFRESKADAYARNEKQRNIMLGIVAGLITLIVVFIVISSKMRKKKMLAYEAQLKQNRERYSNFMKDYTDRDETEALYRNKTVYDAALVGDFYIYNQYVRHILAYAVTGILILMFFFSMISSTESLITNGFFILILGYFIYKQFSQTTKLMDNQKKKYREPKETTIFFYSDCFVVKSPGSKKVYCYYQIEDLRKYKNCIYLYVGPQIAVYLKAQGFEKGNQMEFTRFIREKMAENKAKEKVA